MRKYPDAASQATSVTDLGGRVLYGVDGTKLEASSSLRAAAAGGGPQRFSKIVFNFPHAGEG